MSIKIFKARKITIKRNNNSHKIQTQNPKQLNLKVDGKDGAEKKQ